MAKNSLRKNLPRHVAIIMDGNGRWAKRHHLPRIHGHQKGVQAVRESIQAASELGIEYLTLYAFSIENWKRPKTEVAALMSLLAKTLKDQKEELLKNNIRLKTIGRLEDLPQQPRKVLQGIIEATQNNTGSHLILALSYGSRVEILEATQKIAQKVSEGKLKATDIDEKTLEQHLYTSGIPDPDLLIRTSGELRLSNFLLWQMSYTEIYVTPVFWPDFKKKHFFEAIEEYKKRHRRFGSI